MTAPRVLVAEDDPDVRELVAVTLADAGMDVDVASDGREALEKVAAHKPDLVLLDIMMPVMSGREFAGAIQETTDPPPMVVMTAVDNAPQTAADIHAVGWLAKPFDIDELVTTVRRFVDGHS